MANDVDLIKSRLDIVDVIGEYVKLKQSGQNWKGLCPFHGEKTPSFMVHRAKQIWRCFGCGLGGDVFSFVEKLENIEFPEALELLARKAGVELTRAPGAAAAESGRSRLFRILELATKYYQEQLTHSPLAATARAYVAKRAISPESVTTFKLGYALPEWDKLTVYLRNQGISPGDLIACGLSIKSERGPGLYDRFRDRLLFPIVDAQGRVVGFGGRTLDPAAKEAKYINSPQSPVYNKSLVLYNLDLARTAIREAGYAVLVEGYMDVIGSWQAGVKNVVASSGTALTLEQVQLLKRHTDSVRLTLDADQAGQDAFWRGLDVLIRQEFAISAIRLPFGKDPDECARQDPAAYQKAIAEAVPFGDYMFDIALSRFDKGALSGKKKIADYLLAVFDRFPNPIERDYYYKRIAEELGVSESAIRERQPHVARSVAEVGVVPTAEPTKPVLTRIELLTASLLALGLRFPEHLPWLFDNLEPTTIAGQAMERLYRQLLIYYTERHTIDLEGFESELVGERDLGALLATLQLQGEHEFASLSTGEASKEITRLTRDLKTTFTKAELKTLSSAIAEAERAGHAPDSALLERFAEVSRQLTQVQD